MISRKASLNENPGGSLYTTGVFLCADTVKRVAKGKDSGRSADPPADSRKAQPENWGVIGEVPGSHMDR